MYLKPLPGMRVRDPVTTHPLPPEGAEVKDSPHWRKRLRDGDVVLSAPPPKAGVKAVLKQGGDQ